MKKVLLATTVLSFAAGSAFAAGPTVTIGGSADVQVGVASQDSAYTTTANTGETQYTRDTHSRTNTKINVKVDGRTDSGLGYGANIELSADVNQNDNTSANNNANRGLVYVQSALGRVEAGPTGSAGEALGVGASTLARGTGGIAGDFYHYVDLDGNTGGTTVSDTYVFLPGLPTSAFPGTIDNGASTANQRTNLATANKISYYSPRISGVQLGVSYTPDLEERGTANGFSGNGNGNATSIKDIWNAGLNYQGQFQGVGVEAAATGEWGSNESTTRDDLRAYSLGVNVSYMGFTVGGSWADVPQFGQTKANNTDARYWTLGGAYEFGPFGASVTYLNSRVNNDGSATAPNKDFNNTVVSADYQLAPGLVPYVEVAFFNTDDNTAASADNSGNVFLVGTELTF